jgi:DNA repair protein RadC
VPPSDVELLAALLESITPAARLLDHYQTLQRLERAGIAEWAAVAKIDRARAERIAAALALGRRLATKTGPPEQPLRTIQQVWRRFAPRVGGETRECFWAIALDAQLRVAAEVQVAVGSLTAVHVHPREAFRALVGAGAAAALFVHNHPSGDPTPSRDDLRLSARLVKAGALLGIGVVDHVVVTGDAFASALPRRKRA